MVYNWHWLDPEKWNPAKQQDLEHVNINVRLSPHDVPRAVRGIHDSKNRLFIIEFQYIDDEPWKREKHGEGVCVRVGKHSGRIYGIEIDVKDKMAGAVSIDLAGLRLAKRAVNKLSRSTKNKQIGDSYGIVRKVIKDCGSSLFQTA